MGGNAIPERVQASLRTLVEYLWSDESLDYELSPRPDRDKHIFRDVMVVEQWLSQISKEGPRSRWKWPG